MPPWGHKREEATVVDDTTRRIGFIGPQIPTRIAARLLSCSIEAPSELQIGRQRPFRFHVRNVAPTSLSIDLPEGRRWGWNVGDVPEAGVGRFDPPTEPTRLAFGPLERRTFTFHWDGLFRANEEGHDVWTPAPGTHRLAAYVALEDWRTRGAYATTTIHVIDR